MSRLRVSALLAAVLLFGAGCVSRNVERIDGEEAAVLGAPPAPLSAEERANAGAQLPGIEGTVSVAAGVGTVPSGTLYVIVRVAGREGGPPLAVQPLSPEFPVQFRITEADAMIPGTPLAGFDLDVVARLDQDGDPLSREPGDLVGTAGPVRVGDSVEIVLDVVSESSDQP